MHHARRLLREANTTVAAVAGRVGYQTEPAFSRAFTRWVWITPGAFKRDNTQHIRPATSLRHPTGPEPH
jgi:AraC-like DNA-binding protein